MSHGELFIGTASAVITLAIWVPWYLHPARLKRLGAPASGGVLVRLAPILCIGILLLVLRTLASHDVREDPRYLTMYSLLGAAWVGLSLLAVPAVGLHVRDDVFERGNAAAAYAIGGALVGLTLAFAGGNIGDGPGWWVVIFSAALATAALYLLWALYERFAHVSEHVTVERDRAAGARLAGFLVAVGLILGRAAAGDWVSASATLVDFARVGSPALVVLLIAIPIERMGRPTAEHPTRPLLAWGI